MKKVAGAGEAAFPNAPTATRLARRTMDVVLGAMLLVVTTPVVAASTALIYLIDGRPAFFRQDREGLGGASFQLVKLRTMKRDAEAQLAHLLRADPALADEFSRRLCLVNDPRVLPHVGRLLRRLSIDEVPQLWCVVKGDMSLVGPRPLPLHLVELMPPDYLALRRQVKPGLTGLWQVSGRSENNIDDWIRLDLEYLRHWSLRRDVMILARTPRVLLSGRGAH